MKTLYEQLTDEQREQLDFYGTKYPQITARITETLKEEYHSTNIILSIALDIHNCFCKGSFDFCEFTEIFEN